MHSWSWGMVSDPGSMRMTYTPRLVSRLQLTLSKLMSSCTGPSRSYGPKARLVDVDD